MFLALAGHRFVWFDPTRPHVGQHQEISLGDVFSEAGPFGVSEARVHLDEKSAWFQFGEQEVDRHIVVDRAAEVGGTHD